MGPMLARARERAQITQAEAAKAVGVHAQTLSEWERGIRKVSGEALPVLLNLYHVTLEDIQLLSGTAAQLNGNVKRGTSRPLELQTGQSPVGERVVREISPRFNVEISFASPTSAQKGRMWVEQFLTELAEEGATQDFIDSARRHLLNADNYVFDVERAAGQLSPMNDEEKLEHMKGLAQGMRAVLKSRQKKGRGK